MTKSGAIVEVGDIVTVAEEGVSRGKWRLGKVEELITGKDGEIRGAKVKVLTKKGKPMYLNRPVQKLYPLEVRGPVQTRQTVTEPVGEERVQTRGVPRRAAAIDADFRRRCVQTRVQKRGVQTRGVPRRAAAIDADFRRRCVQTRVQKRGVQTRGVPRRAAAIDADFRRRVDQLLANQGGRTS